jgi:hypothetical protein
LATIRHFRHVLRDGCARGAKANTIYSHKAKALLLLRSALFLCLLSSITDFLKVVAVVVAGSDKGCQTHRVEFRRRQQRGLPSLIFPSRLAAEGDVIAKIDMGVLPL